MDQASNVERLEPMETLLRDSPGFLLYWNEKIGCVVVRRGNIVLHLMSSITSVAGRWLLDILNIYVLNYHLLFLMLFIHVTPTFHFNVQLMFADANGLWTMLPCYMYVSYRSEINLFSCYAYNNELFRREKTYSIVSWHSKIDCLRSGPSKWACSQINQKMRGLLHQNMGLHAIVE